MTDASRFEANEINVIPMLLAQSLRNPFSKMGQRLILPRRGDFLEIQKLREQNSTISEWFRFPPLNTSAKNPSVPEASWRPKDWRFLWASTPEGESVEAGLRAFARNSYGRWCCWRPVTLFSKLLLSTDKQSLLISDWQTINFIGRFVHIQCFLRVTRMWAFPMATVFSNSDERWDH